MTQAYNLSQLANNLNSSGQLDAADGLVNAVPVANGGTGATNSSGARTNLGLGALATLNTVGNSQIDNGAVTPAKLSTGAPSWSTGGALTLSGAPATYALNVPGSGLFYSTGETQLHISGGTTNRDVYLFVSASGNFGAYDLTNSKTLWSADSSANFKFNSGYGTDATAYGCRAWVTFDGTGTTATNQTIKAGGNVATVYKNGTGDYTLTFTNAMPDSNYCVVVNSPTYSATISGVYGSVKGGTAIGNPATKTTTQLRVCFANTGNPAVFYDSAEIYVVIFR